MNTGTTTRSDFNSERDILQQLGQESSAHPERIEHGARD